MNSIKKYYTPKNHATYIAMLRNANKARAFLLVEGSTDSSLFKKFLNRDYAEPINAFNKKWVIDVVHQLETMGVPGIVGFVDRDFDQDSQIQLYGENVIVTDENDIEIMVIYSDALYDVVREFGSENKVNTIEATTGKRLSDILCEEAAIIGALRLICSQEHGGISFKNVKYRFSGTDELKVDVDAMATTLVQRASGCLPYSPSELVQRARELVDYSPDKKAICNGHDVVELLRWGLRKRLGSCSTFNSKNGGANLAKVLRLAYQFSSFCCTHAYASMKEWERKTGYVLF
jgi:hypothetical protein